jgi:hypothetical protein
MPEPGGILAFFMRLVHGEPTWPPKILKDHWEEIEERRRRARNDYGEMLQNTPHMNQTEHRASIYTPVPMAREMARLSSSLLFSDPVKITLPDEEEAQRRERVAKRQEEKDARNPFLPGSPAQKKMTTGGVGSEAPATKKKDVTDPEDNPEAGKPEEMATAALREPPRQSRRQKLLEKLIELNGLDAFLQESGETVAVEGRGAIRIIRDEDVAEGEPFLTFVPEDQILWDERHGRVVVGATAVFEFAPAVGSAETETREVYRMFEEHIPGSIDRKVYKGTVNHIGKPVGEGEWPEVWKDTKPHLDTGLDACTMVRWDNVPGGQSDIQGLDALLDTLDEAESLMLDKGRKSIPKTFANRSLADDNGEIDLEGVILTGDENLGAEYGSNPVQSVEVAQPELQSTDHILWVDHVREMIATHAGYSSATWGIGEEGRSDSGTALQLRQARTLLTRAGKDRMAREAIINAVAVALCWMDGKQKVRDYRPEVMLGTGLPTDSLEKAQEITSKYSAGVISLRQAVRELHPEWTEEQVDEEVEEIEEAKMLPPALDPMQNGGLSLELGGEKDEDKGSEEGGKPSD